MDAQWMYELIGYAASVLVAISLTMSSLVRLRLINLVGAVTFTVYGLLINAYPVAAVNLFIVFVNLFYLSRMLRTREFLKILEIEPRSEYLRAFLDFHAEDIRRSLPDFAYQPGERQLAFFILRDMVPAGLFIGEVRDDGSLMVRLDFVIPSYRDFKIGRYLFSEQAEFFRSKGIRELVSPAGSPKHATYLRRMGFAPAEREGATTWRRALAPAP
jgi:GNAT superfamily N-acetyltransferase